MKANITFAANEKATFSSVNVKQNPVTDAVKAGKEAWMAVLTVIAAYYSSLIGEELSVEKTARILNAQAAFASLLVLGSMNVVLLVVSLVWFITALLKCRG